MATDVYTTEEMAAKLNAAEATVRKWAEAGEIPGSFKVGQLWRFRRAAVDPWLEARV